MTPSTPITSLTNARVKAAVRLRDRRERAATGLTIVDGAREILRALDAGIAVAEAFVAPDLVRTPDAHQAADRLRAAGEALETTPAVLAKVAFGDRSDGVVAVVRTPELGLDDLLLSVNPLVVVVEGVEKPGNLGAVLRTADGAGVDAVIVADPLTDPFNPNAIRASLGTIFTIPVATAPAPVARDWLGSQGIRPVAAIVGGPTLYTETDLSGPLAIVLGSEADGLSDAWRGDDVEGVSIPMLGAADSLNVSIAGAVLLYEAVRQRHATSDPAH
jgi:TrmH family RNA methyltransferase